MAPPLAGSGDIGGGEILPRVTLHVEPAQGETAEWVWDLEWDYEMCNKVSILYTCVYTCITCHYHVHLCPLDQ